MPGKGLSREGSVAPLTATFTSIPPSSSPLSEARSDPDEELDDDCEPVRDDEAVLGLPWLEELLDEELLDEELLELGSDGEEDEDDEELGGDGIEDGDEEELGIDGADEADGEDEALGIDGIEDELLELDWVDSQPLSTRPRVTATARALSVWDGVLMLRSSTVASLPFKTPAQPETGPAIV